MLIGLGLIVPGLSFFTAKNLGPFLATKTFSSIKKDFHQSALAYPMAVNKDLVSWQELDQVLEFEEMFWQNGPLSWQLKGLVFNKDYEKKFIINLLLERKIIEQFAKEHRLPDLSSDEIEAAKIASFGYYQGLSFSSHSEMQARAVTRALKTKIDKDLVQRYSGVLIYIKFQSPGAVNFADPQALALKKTNELYQKAKGGLDIDSLVELANSDPEIILLNGNAFQEVFDNFSLDDFSIPSPEIPETIKDLVPGQVSQVFGLSAIMDPTVGELKTFAYGFFKITKVSGSVQSLENIIQQIKDSAVIEININ